MPELPEVETVCRQLRKSILGCRIEKVEAKEDNLVFKGLPAKHLEEALKGRTVKSVGRKGKYFWICFDKPPCLLAHFGMSGWADVIGAKDELPKFTKLSLDFGDKRLAFSDARRLGRIWLAEDPQKDRAIKQLGPDCLTDLPSHEQLVKSLAKRKIAIKAVLLDQTAFAGVGNYLADEVLFQARIAPKRDASELTEDEIKKLRSSIKKVIKTAVDAEADENRFPQSWLFHHRWGGKRGDEKIGRYKITREEVGGRTTAWVPALQK
jgi:formamidopyrimidine-DNA glycosylase